MINTFRVTLTILGKCCMRSLELQNNLQFVYAILVDSHPDFLTSLFIA